MLTLSKIISVKQKSQSKLKVINAQVRYDYYYYNLQKKSERATPHTSVYTPNLTKLPGALQHDRLIYVSAFRHACRTNYRAYLSSKVKSPYLRKRRY